MKPLTSMAFHTVLVSTHPPFSGHSSLLILYPALEYCCFSRHILFLPKQSHPHLWLLLSSTHWWPWNSYQQTFPLGSNPVYLAVNFSCPFQCLPGISDPAGLSIFLPKPASLQYNLSCWMAWPSTPLPTSEPGSASWYLFSLVPYPHLSVLSPDYILNTSMSFNFSYHHPVQATIVSHLDNYSSLLTVDS